MAKWTLATALVAATSRLVRVVVSCQRVVAMLLGIVAITALLAPATVGQSKGKKKDAWRTDPYTAGDAAAMKRAGVVKYGPLSWADDHDTAAIDAMIPEARVLWMETEHFRIGSTLPPLSMPRDSKARRRLAGELKELKKQLPKVRSKARKLDRWLRLHLFAKRLEATYKNVARVLQVDANDFPKQYVGKLPIGRGQDFMGLGPHFGMGDKYCILLLNKPSNLTRYGNKCGQPQPAKPCPIALHFYEKGSLLFGTSQKLVPSQDIPDYRLRVHIEFNASLLLMRGFRHYSHGLPAWLEEGFGNSLLRERDPEQHVFSNMSNWDKERAYPKKWAVSTRRLIKNGFAKPAKSVSRHALATGLTFNDHVCSWSRVDFMRSFDDGKRFAEFVRLVNAPMPAESGKAPEFASVLVAQDRALQQVFGMNWEQFDEAWQAYVMAQYPRK